LVVSPPRERPTEHLGEAMIGLRVRDLVVQYRKQPDRY
jgi:hypothetical protein